MSTGKKVLFSLAVCGEMGTSSICTNTINHERKRNRKKTRDREVEAGQKTNKHKKNKVRETSDERD